MTPRFILFGEKSLRHVLKEDGEPHHHKRPHQGIGNVIPFSSCHPAMIVKGPPIVMSAWAGR